MAKAVAASNQGRPPIESIESDLEARVGAAFLALPGVRRRMGYLLRCAMEAEGFKLKGTGFVVHGCAFKSAAAFVRA